MRPRVEVKAYTVAPTGHVDGNMRTQVGKMLKPNSCGDWEGIPLMAKYVMCGASVRVLDFFLFIFGLLTI